MTRNGAQTQQWSHGTAHIASAPVHTPLSQSALPVHTSPLAATCAPGAHNIGASKTCAEPASCLLVSGTPPSYSTLAAGPHTFWSGQGASSQHVEHTWLQQMPLAH
jgi:hypothetical protein